jgi:hypothetical protein
MEPMDHLRLEFPEVAGKSVLEFSVQDDPDYGREVLLRFTDGTQLSVCVGVRQTVDARYCSEDTPDQPIFVRHDFANVDEVRLDATSTATKI